MHCGGQGRLGIVLSEGFVLNNLLKEYPTHSYVMLANGV